MSTRSSVTLLSVVPLNGQIATMQWAELLMGLVLMLLVPMGLVLMVLVLVLFVLI